MYYQQAVRIQRPKGHKVTQGLQLVLIVVFCIWILYQMKHSHYKKKDYGEALENRHDFKQAMGRKASVGSSDVYESIDSVSKKVSKHKEGKNGKRGNEKRTLENSIIDEVRATYNKIDEVRGTDNNIDEEGIADEIVAQMNETESSLIRRHGESGHGFTGFSDENGVPVEGHEFTRHSLNGTDNDQHQGMSRLHTRTNKQVTDKVPGIYSKVPQPKTDAASGKLNTKVTANSIVQNRAVRGDSKAFTSQQVIKNITDRRMHT